MSDFQDYGQWKIFNYSTLKEIHEKYSGTIIVPMTIISPQYYNEIIKRQIDDGIILKHYILYANKGALLKRLNRHLSRGDTWAKRNTAATRHIIRWTQVTELKTAAFSCRFLPARCTNARSRLNNYTRQLPLCRTNRPNAFTLITYLA